MSITRYSITSIATNGSLRWGANRDICPHEKIDIPEAKILVLCDLLRIDMGRVRQNIGNKGLMRKILRQKELKKKAAMPSEPTERYFEPLNTITTILTASMGYSSKQLKL